MKTKFTELFTLSWGNEQAKTATHSYANRKPSANLCGWRSSYINSVVEPESWFQCQFIYSSAMSWALILPILHSTLFPKTFTSTWPTDQTKNLCINRKRISIQYRCWFDVVDFLLRTERPNPTMHVKIQFVWTLFLLTHSPWNRTKFIFVCRVHFLRHSWRAHKEFHIESEKKYREKEIKEKLKEPPAAKTNSNIAIIVLQAHFFLSFSLLCKRFFDAHCTNIEWFH